MRNTLARTLFSGVVWLSALLCAATFCAAQDQAAAAAAADVQVIPRPRQLKMTPALFRLTRDVRLALADARSEDDRFAVQDFIDDLHATAALELKTGARHARHTILVGPLDSAPVQAALKRAGLSVPAQLDDEGYALSVSASEVVVGGKTAAGTFYGMQTLKQLVRGDGADAFLPGVQIVDWPALRWRAVSDDISRGPIPTVEYVKRQLRTEAMYKLNMHSFYMEQVFASETHPLTGPPQGALTPEEIRELVAYARRYHIELVPEQQTFGHLHKVLRLEEYNDLAETPYGDVLSPQQPETYTLIADWYKELDALFPGRFFHIGADETFELGEGQSRAQVQAQGVGAIYFAHLNRVRDILKPYNRRLMFWGDIALNHPELLKSVPRDMIVMNWQYGARDDFKARIKPFKDAGLEQFVCPGVQNWNQIFPNEDAAVKNITNFVRDGQAAGALGMMNTSWDDDGETLFEATWYGIVLGAAASWQSAPMDAAQFDRDFDWAFFRREGTDLVGAIRALGGVNTLLGAGASDPLFWREPFTAGFQQRARELHDKVREMRLSVEGAEETLRAEGREARRNRSMIAVMRLAAARFDHLGRRMEVVEQFSRDYWQAYLNLGDARKVHRLNRYTGAIYNSLREMAEDLATIKQAYRTEWLAENRTYWLDSVIARYDLAIANWLDKSKRLAEALREYDESTTLPGPDEFGLGEKPQF
ncbi:MAG TPA: beta-N-acetylhexosaminidase [Pyrinomonadaceae bacterium]